LHRGLPIPHATAPGPLAPGASLRPLRRWGPPLLRLSGVRLRRPSEGPDTAESALKQSMRHWSIHLIPHCFSLFSDPSNPDFLEGCIAFFKGCWSVSQWRGTGAEGKGKVKGIFGDAPRNGFQGPCRTQIDRNTVVKKRAWSETHLGGGVPQPWAETGGRRSYLPRVSERSPLPWHHPYWAGCRCSCPGLWTSSCSRSSSHGSATPAGRAPVGRLTPPLLNTL